MFCKSSLPWGLIIITMVVPVVNNKEEEMNTKKRQKANPKLINRRISGQDQKQRTDLFFINKALQKFMFLKRSRSSALEKIIVLIHSLDTL